MEKLLSIVIPVYKVEKYINKCLDSVIISDDNMKRLEVIVINDGTPDNSAVMAKEYEKRYPDTIKVYDKENGGHGSAWNKGVEMATGKYLRFLDSDDWLTNFEEFVNYLKNCDTDLVFSDLDIFYQEANSHVLVNLDMIKKDVTYDLNDFDWDLTQNRPFWIANFHMCTYKTELMKKYHPLFLENQFYDDEILYVMPLCIAASFSYFPHILYNYLIGRQGQTVDPEIKIRNLDYHINVRSEMMDFYMHHKPKSIKLNNKIEHIIDARCNLMYYAISQLSYKHYKEKCKRWSDAVMNYHPYPNRSKAYVLSRKSLLMLWFYYHYYRRMINLYHGVDPLK